MFFLNTVDQSLSDKYMCYFLSLSLWDDSFKINYICIYPDKFYIETNRNIDTTTI